MHRGTTTEISLSALSHNLSGVRRLCGNRPVIAVVKADAYGHGAVEVSRRLLRDGASFLAVAFAEEARELREASLACPILVLFDPDVREVLAQDGIPVIADMRVAEALSRETGRAGRSVGVHVKVDTGMGRLGLRGDVAAQVLSLSRLPGISVEGVMTHLSDADLSDPVAAGEQIRRFRSLQTALAGAGLKIPCLHMANSAAVLALPEAHFDAADLFDADNVHALERPGVAVIQTRLGAGGFLAEGADHTFVAGIDGVHAGGQPKEQDGPGSEGEDSRQMMLNPLAGLLEGLKQLLDRLWLVVLVTHSVLLG